MVSFMPDLFSHSEVNILNLFRPLTYEGEVSTRSLRLLLKSDVRTIDRPSYRDERRVINLQSQGVLSQMSGGVYPASETSGY